MARIIVLGPSQWKGPDDDRPSPMETRREIQGHLRADGHVALLLEDFPGAGPPLQDKFEEALSKQDVTDVVVYWPAGAKTITLQQERVILYGKHPDLRVWILHETSVLRLQRGAWIVADGERGRYTNDLLNAAHSIHAWNGNADLRGQIRLLSADVHAMQDHEHC